jgi:hypothetical protein
MGLKNMNRNTPMFLGFGFSAFFFFCSVAFLCYVIFFNTTSGWIYLVCQLLSALAVALLISSVMAMTAITMNSNVLAALKTK